MELLFVSYWEAGIPVFLLFLISLRFEPFQIINVFYKCGQCKRESIAIMRLLVLYAIQNHFPPVQDSTP